MKPVAPKSIAPFKFEGAEIRCTPSGEMVAIDVLSALRVKSPRSAWRNLKEDYGKEFCAQISTYSFGGRGRPSEVVSPALARKIGMVVKGEYGAKWRDFLNGLYEFVEKGGEEVANYGVDTENDPAALERIALRAKTKKSVISLTSTASKRGMKRRHDFAKLNDSNNVFVTSSTAKELQVTRGVNITRDSFTDIELATLDLLQVTQREHIENTDAQGAGQILDRQEDVRSVLRPFRDQFLGKKTRPHSKDGQEPVLTVDV